MSPRTPTKSEQQQARKQAQQARDQVKIVGSGWSTVAVRKMTGDSATGAPPELQAFLSKLQVVKGNWGSGRLLAGNAFSAVLTDDGRIAVGAVTPETLYKALG